MASSAYYQWVDAGKPYVRSRPAREFRDVVRGHGYTVYDYPDDSHLQAATPEDHTPFSATGWPIASKRWVGHADDIMPGGPVPLPKLARQIIADVDARLPGTEWVKYMNWTDETGACRHESWANSEHKRVTTNSTDKGHIHISARSDMDTSDTVSRNRWDPVARAQGVQMSVLTPVEELFLIEIAYRASAVLFDYDKTGPWTDPRDDKTVRDEPNNLKKRMLAEHSEVMTTLQQILDAVGAGMSDAQVAALADRIAAAVVIRPDNTLGDDDKPAIREAVAEVLRSGADAVS